MREIIDVESSIIITNSHVILQI